MECVRLISLSVALVVLATAARAEETTDAAPLSLQLSCEGILVSMESEQTTIDVTKKYDVTKGQQAPAQS